ncbi:hypothetical protein C8Q79DRAFT_970271 [Trametes meyenii]|nr:hypothetical protein C8Q79DRAFT_970271 [Trametes meyenii]
MGLHSLRSLLSAHRICLRPHHGHASSPSRTPVLRQEPSAASTRVQVGGLNCSLLMSSCFALRVVVSRWVKYVKFGAMSWWGVLIAQDKLLQGVSTNKGLTGPAGRIGWTALQSAHDVVQRLPLKIPICQTQSTSGNEASSPQPAAACVFLLPEFYDGALARPRRTMNVAPLSSEAADGSLGDLEHTDFIKDPIVLETNVSDVDVNLSDLLQAWGELHPVSVEVALAGQSDIFTFANEHCLFFAAVLWNHTVPLNSLAPPDATPVFSETEPTDETEEESEPVMERVWDTVGVVYIATSTLPRQVHVGIAVRPPFRSKGLGRRACELALEWALDTLQMHRVQARIVESPSQNRARVLFAALGFSHEGMQRRAVMNAAGEWTDVVQMGVLDTDWAMRAQRRGPRSTSLWDELLQRYQSEVDELLRWDDGGQRVRRTSSMETLRGARGADECGRGRQVCSLTPSSFTYTTDSTMSSRSSSIGLGSRRSPARSPSPPSVSNHSASTQSEDGAFTAEERRALLLRRIRERGGALEDDGGEHIVPPVDARSASEAESSDIGLGSEWERLTSGSADRGAPSEQISSFSSGEPVSRPPSSHSASSSSYCSIGSFHSAGSKEEGMGETERMETA